jgi:hypothetical protein
LPLNLYPEQGRNLCQTKVQNIIIRQSTTQKLLNNADQPSHHNKEAAKHYTSGNHEKACHHVHLAHAHNQHVHQHSNEAAKSHLENHEKK